MSEASILTNQIINFIYENGGYAWRASSTGIYDQGKQAYRTAAKKGVSDILACIPPSGRLIAVEIKIGRDRLSPEQDGFIRNIRAVGGIAFTACNFDDFVVEWESYVKK